MQQTAFVIGSRILCGYSLIFTLSIGASLYFFLYLCGKSGIPEKAAHKTAALVFALSVVLCRLLYWDCRPEQFPLPGDLVLDTSLTHFALSGVFFACAAAAFVMRKRCSAGMLLDCMSAALCGGIALGRLGFFFTAYDRGSIAEKITAFPLVYPAGNPVTNLPEYRVATFFLQSLSAAVLCFFLVKRLRKEWQKKLPEGNVTTVFLLVYCACQVLLDSTRYDSLYFRFNGFVSMVQVFSALALAGTLTRIGAKAAKINGKKKNMIAAWIALPILIGGAGYMEYYVQRHARQALFAYCVMGLCLAAIIALGLRQLEKTFPK